MKNFKEEHDLYNEIKGLICDSHLYQNTINSDNNSFYASQLSIVIHRMNILREITKKVNELHKYYNDIFENIILNDKELKDE